MTLLKVRVSFIKWTSASEELKGGDGKCHASLDRLCAANKKCVSVCQSASASGPSVRFSPFTKRKAIGGTVTFNRQGKCTDQTH